LDIQIKQFEFQKDLEIKKFEQDKTKLQKDIIKEREDRLHNYDKKIGSLSKKIH